MRHVKEIGLRDMVARLGARGWAISESAYAHLEAGRRIISDCELMLILRVLGADLTALIGKVTLSPLGKRPRSRKSKTSE